MLRGRERSEWCYTASICAVIANSAPRSKKDKRKMYKPDDFSPYRLTGADRKVSFKQMLGLMRDSKALLED